MPDDPCVVTIDKAIKNLKAGRKDAGMIPEAEYTATIDLAIEALTSFRYRAEGGRCPLGMCISSTD